MIVTKCASEHTISSENFGKIFGIVLMPAFTVRGIQNNYHRVEVIIIIIINVHSAVGYGDGELLEVVRMDWLGVNRSVFKYRKAMT